MDEQLHATVVDNLREFLERQQNLTIRDADEDLLNSGIMDSLILVELILFIESRFDIPPSIDDIDVHFSSLNSIAAYIQHHATTNSRGAVN